MVGMSYQESTNDNVYGSLSANSEDAIKKNDPLFYYLNYGSASATKGVAGEKIRSAKLSYFGRVGYEFAGRYFCRDHFVPMQPTYHCFPPPTAGILSCSICRMDPVGRRVLRSAQASGK
jgi:hypothetical protein